MYTLRIPIQREHHRLINRNKNGQYGVKHTSHLPPSNMNAAYAASVKLGVGSGIGAGKVCFLALFQMNCAPGLLTSTPQKYLQHRANESTSRVDEVCRRISARISRGNRVISHRGLASWLGEMEGGGVNSRFLRFGGIIQKT